MANNKTTYTLQIDAEINSLEKKLGTIQNLMQNVMNSADAPKGLEKSFEKIGSLIDKIRTKASAPIDSKSGFTSIGKDIEAVNIALGSLYKMIGSVGEMSEASRISFLPPEAQKEIATIIKSIEAYQAAIASATTETAELIEARKELAKAETTKSKADADLELKQQSLDRAKQE